ncbi:hypothetical protein CC78DRAFT_49867 [Lojkania enalia]|uniref:Uncharacterized protein n=1 Tax=Lojkania enalia TaxID=147567 RepID=A0A9P4KFM1_9PLEO|nr:hypothetical protein CC78DRAFT_49867 [Didymosphaeria enalia]
MTATDGRSLTAVSPSVQHLGNRGSLFPRSFHSSVIARLGATNALRPIKHPHLRLVCTFGIEPKTFSLQQIAEWWALLATILTNQVPSRLSKRVEGLTWERREERGVPLHSGTNIRTHDALLRKCLLLSLYSLLFVSPLAYFQPLVRPKPPLPHCNGLAGNGRHAVIGIVYGLHSMCRASFGPRSCTAERST